MSDHEGSEPVIVGFLCNWCSYWRLTLDDIASAVPTQHSASAHDMNLPTALELGRQLGLDLPRRIEIFAIEAVDVVTFGETCTPDVAAAIPVVTEPVLQTLA